jgi:biopolymer transport protein ExbD/biopolymer transport protein TolR
VASKNKKRQRLRPVMNVTPLVDVVLVLLIIFMVVIPALQQGVQIEYAGIVHTDDKSDEKKKEPWNVAIDREGELFIEEESVAWKKAELALKKLAAKAPGRRLVLHGDKTAPYKKVRDVYRMAQEVGFPGISIRVNRVSDGEGEEP